MAIPTTDSTAKALVNGGGTVGSSLATPPARADKPPLPTKTKDQNIRVSPAVLNAALKGGEEVIRSLGTTFGGLTQTEAKERACTVGPNEVAQEHRKDWFVRILRIIRNPLVILLATLSAISYVTGDARAAGT